MGIYIKDMNPPNDCYECPFTKWVDDGCSGCWADSKIHNASRPDDCSLIEIPEPHMESDAKQMEEPIVNIMFTCADISVLKHVQIIFEAEWSDDE